MIKEAIQIIVDNYNRASGGGVYWALYILAIVFAFIYVKRKEVKSVLPTYAIVNALVIFNPIVVSVVDKLLEGDKVSVYWRVFWTMPMGIAIAYMFTQLVFVNKTTLKKVVVFFSCAIMIMLLGKYIYKPGIFDKTANFYKIPDNELDMVNTITALREKDNNEDEFVKAFFPPEINAHARQIDAYIIIGYARSALEIYNVPIMELTLQGNLPKAIVELRKGKFDYFVWNKDIPFEAYEGLELIKTNEQYKLFRVLTLDEVKQMRIEKGESLDNLNE